MLSASPANPTRKENEPKHKANDAKKLKSLDAKKDGSKENDTKVAPWTSAQDAKLLEMKAANRSWKDIETEIGKPKHIAQPRFKELQGQGKAATGADQGKDKKTTDHELKVAEKKKKWEATAIAKKENQGKKEAKKGKENQEKMEKGAAKDDDKRDRAKVGAEKKYTLAQLSKVEDRNFSMRELGIIAALATGLGAKEQFMWEVIASRYFDRTGCRVDGEDLRDRFEALDKA